MARKPLIKKLDLYGAVPYGSSEPTGTNGDLFYNTSDAVLKIYIGEWITIGSGGVVGGTFEFMDGVDFQFMDGTYFDFMDA